MGIYKETVNKVRVGGEIRTLRTTNYELDLAQFYIDLAAVGATVDRAMFEAALLEIDKSITQYSDLVLVPGIYKAGSVFAFNGMTKSFEEFAFSRGSSGSYTDANGFLQVQTNGSMPRISYAFATPFYLLEPASMNYVLNSLETKTKYFQTLTKATAGATYTISFIATKPGTLGIYNGGSSMSLFFPVTNSGSGEFRFKQTFTIPAKDDSGKSIDGTVIIQVYLLNNLEVREVQLEPGYFQTSHIVTTATIGVRAAEKLVAKRQIVSETNIPLINSLTIFNACSLDMLRKVSGNLFNLLTITGSSLQLQQGKTYTFSVGGYTSSSYLFMHIWPVGGTYGDEYNTDFAVPLDGSLKSHTFVAKGTARVELFVEVQAGTGINYTYKPTLVEGTKPLIIKYDNELAQKTDREMINTLGLQPSTALQLRSLCILTSNQLPA